MTFKNGGIDKIINQISLEHLILETDSPYLSQFLIEAKGMKVNTY